MVLTFISLYLLILKSFLMTCSNINKPSLISIPYQVYFGSFCFHLSIGEPLQDLFHAIDQEREFTWTANTFYFRERSNSFKVLNETKLRFRHLDMYGSIFEETINITQDNQIDNFPFYVINDTRGFNSRVGAFGFAYKFRNKNYSIIHRLKEDNQIDYLAYSFVPHNKINGSFYLGGIPPDAINKKKATSCKVTGQHANWACDLSYVFFGNISYVYDNVYYNNHDHAFFQVADKRILAPEAFIDYLKNEYFKHYIEEHKCKPQLLSMNREFVCECNMISTLPLISFIFDSIAYEFNAEDLFEVNGSQCIFLIASNHIRDKNWLFGTVFLNHFTSLFDYEKGLVTFYSGLEGDRGFKVKIEGVDLDKLFPWKKLLRWSINIIVVFLIAGLIYYYCIRSKKRQRLRKDPPSIEGYQEMK